MADKDLILKTAEELLSNLKVEGQTEVSQDEENSFKVQIENQDPGILIGYHGETLASFQLILSLMVFKTLGEWRRLIVNVGDWRERREEVLRQMAVGAAEKVLSSGEPMSFPSLSSFERRVIHLTLADHPGVMTVSEGEGEGR